MKEKREFIEGEIIGNFVFVKEDFHEKEVTGRQAYRMGVFKCFCGDLFITRITGILNGKVKSCGCERRRKSINRFRRHGMSYTSEYEAWGTMKARCYRKDNKFYKNYGGRGIVVCDRWLEKFDNFFEDMGFKPSKEYSLERIDVNGNYEPSNCKWATRKEQDRNRRSNIYIEYNGERKVLKDWADEYNIYPQTLKSRIERGMPIQSALTKEYKYEKKNDKLLLPI